MNILLLEHPRSVNPERCNDIANTPLSSCLFSGYIAGMLQSRGHEVEIVEGFLDNLSFDEIADRIRAMQPEIVGVHMVYHWKRDDAFFYFLRQIKEEHACFITAYGFYPTIAFEEILEECEAIDSVILGEPEETFAAFAEAVSCKRDTRALRGTAVRDASGGISRQWAPLIEDLDPLPFPLRTEALYRISEVNVLGSRGCYGKCTFCYINPFYGVRQWRGRSPENIVAEIDAVIAERGARNFYFTDPNFFGPGRQGQERTLRLAALLKERKITFGIEGRVNDIHDRTIGALVEAGLRHILIGMESGNDSSLRRLNKMTTVAQNERALKVLRKHGIEPNIGFIMFEPDSSLQDVRTNFEFLKRNDLLKDLTVTANVLSHHQIVLKGTPAYRELAARGALNTAYPGAYEGTACFAGKEVALLASTMRDITSFLFNRMAEIRSGKKGGPPGARQQGSPKDRRSFGVEQNAAINRLLVETFEYVLHKLEAGAQVERGEMDAVVKNIVEQVDFVYNSPHEESKRWMML